MKCTSAGLVLTDGKSFLGCHSTGNYFYDLPKGTLQEGETPIDACIRETKEEAGLEIDKANLIDLGLHDYNYYKNLHLFLCPVESLPPIVNFTCSSFFYHPIENNYQPEADGFKYIAFDNMEYYLTRNMFRVIKEVYDKVQIKFQDLQLV